ncbi:aldo/keto reductase [Acidipila rosea]|uniref:Aryl-alcohol dehydrogenase-like predicted oxidoreductase n=1 Tax=Acidipila rosea TaxID=768535 RepID=A0A4R1LA93_9BACT|nr:aldo/keto reductase [Acidipila rosea]MBW4027033.1 aldo/keto reductase [Acidobacteriota bacterium]MBW4045101.1 aldo/keto reductase [Acidobacteriota bacterium]TCK75336.1 aryl-alcohol dehydrogenase-like predicted oxidoreductase [Acidipila rosea]
MDYVNLGKTGTKVSRICLGCMSYGNPERGAHRWVLNEEQGRPFIKQALDLGINFFDTANVYSIGASEEVLGRAIRDFARREDVVIASKVHGQMRDTPNGKGLSRKAIMYEAEQSLRRLGTDYLDLYQTHRWDYETPIEETLEALHDLVKAGKVLHIGASSMYAWQFAKALYLSDLHGWARFVTMQPHYNLLYREEEREMLKLCMAEGIGVLPWSPLARGRLARPWTEEASTGRAQTDEYGKKLYAATAEADRAVIDRLGEISEVRGVSRAQIALAWMLHQPAVTAPIVGATKSHHLDDAIASLALKLTDEEIKLLEAPYVPHAVAGFE